MKFRAAAEISRVSSASDASTDAMARWYSFFSSRSVMRQVLIMKLVTVRSASVSAPPCVHRAERPVSIIRPSR